MLSACRTYAEDVNVAPIKHIATATARPLQIFWLMIILLFFGITLHQCSTFLQQLNRHDVNTIITVIIILIF